MAEPLLTDIFGAGATQDATTITILKSDIGVTNTRAESIFAGIVLKGKEYLTQENFDSNIDQSIVVGLGFPSTTVRGTNNVNYRQDQITVTLAKVDDTVLSPNDY